MAVLTRFYQEFKTQYKRNLFFRGKVAFFKRFSRKDLAICTLLRYKESWASHIIKRFLRKDIAICTLLRYNNIIYTLKDSYNILF